MKIVKKNVYYCDYCKGRKLTKHSMVRHEERCTNNPNRQCYLCEQGINIGEYVAELKLRFEIHVDPDTFEQHVNWKGKEITLSEIDSAVEHCPNCTLAVLRQTKLFYECCGLEKFDYKKDFMEYSKVRQAEKLDAYKGWLE